MSRGVFSTSWLEPLGGIGASVAWVMHVQRKAEGARSYDLFIYCCSVLAAVAALMVAVLWLDNERRRAARARRLLALASECGERGSGGGEKGGIGAGR